MEYIESYISIAKKAAEQASAAAEEKYRDYKAQQEESHRTLELSDDEDHILPMDIGIAAEDAAIKILKPWALSTFPLINPYSIKFGEHIGNGIYRVIYKDKEYLMKANAFSQTSLIEIFARERLGKSIGKEMVLYGLLSSDYKPSQFEQHYSNHQKGDICIFFEIEDTVDFPLFFQDAEMSLIMFGVRSMIKSGVDALNIGNIATTSSGNILMNFTSGYFIGEPYLDYASSVDFQGNKYMAMISKKYDVSDHTSEVVLTRYIQKLISIYHTLLQEDGMKTLYQCFDKSLPESATIKI